MSPETKENVLPVAIQGVGIKGFPSVQSSVDSMYQRWDLHTDEEARYNCYVAFCG